MSAALPVDVVVAGAGPAGSTAGALLARRGHRVLIVEKEHFPRFHIGESLLPGGVSVIERLGVTPEDGTTFVAKRGAEFVSEETGRRRVFRFGEALPGCPDYAWHVDRARFDTVLRDAALAAGAEVRHGEAVHGVDVDGDRVRVRTAAETVSARFFVDATGQDRLLARQGDTARPCRRFGSASVFTHFAGLSDAAVGEIGPGNEIRILLRAEGWGWMIPLPERRLSAGVVVRGRVTPDALDEGLLRGDLARRWTEGAERLPTHVTRNFSYRNTAPNGPRFAAIGDASSFVDPVFSSGVALAMRGAEDLADALGPALDAGEEAAADLAERHQPPMDRAVRTFAALIDRFYHSRFASTVLLGEPAGDAMRRGIMTVLAGDVWRDDNPFQEMLLEARRHTGGAM